VQTAQGIGIYFRWNIVMAPMKPALMFNPTYLSAGLVVTPQTVNQTQLIVEFKVSNNGSLGASNVLISIPGSQPGGLLSWIRCALCLLCFRLLNFCR
jgi:hypothetical protein